jgi:hypothetical protein
MGACCNAPVAVVAPQRVPAVPFLGPTIAALPALPIPSTLPVITVASGDEGYWYQDEKKRATIGVRDSIDYELTGK